MIAKVIKKLVKSLLLIYFSMKISLVGAGNIGKEQLTVKSIFVVYANITCADCCPYNEQNALAGALICCGSCALLVDLCCAKEKYCRFYSFFW